MSSTRSWEFEIIFEELIIHKFKLWRPTSRNFSFCFFIRPKPSSINVTMTNCKNLMLFLRICVTFIKLINFQECFILLFIIKWHNIFIAHIINKALKFMGSARKFIFWYCFGSISKCKHVIKIFLHFKINQIYLTFL